MTAGRSETATPPNPTPPSNFRSLGETPPTSAGLVPVSAGLPGEPHLFAPATSGLEHECAGTEVVDPITGTVSTDGPPYTISPNSDHPSSGGAAEGETPDWVPANAVIHIDLVGGTPQGRAWVAGTGEVAVDTLLGESVFMGVAYDPDNLEVGGYVNQAAFIGAAATLLGGDFTLVAEFDTRFHFEMIEETATSDLLVDYDPSSSGIVDNGSNAGSPSSLRIPGEIDVPGDPVPGLGRMAVTYLGETGYGSAHGEKWDSSYVPDGEEDVITIIAMTRPVPCTDFIVGSATLLKSITLYAVKSEEECRLLSVTA